MILQNIPILNFDESQQETLVKSCLMKQIELLQQDKELYERWHSHKIYKKLLWLDTKKACKVLTEQIMSHMTGANKNLSLQVEKLSLVGCLKQVFESEEYDDLYTYETYQTMAHPTNNTHLWRNNIYLIIDNIRKFPESDHKKILLDIISTNHTLFARDIAPYKKFKGIDIDTTKRIIAEDKKLNETGTDTSRSFIKCMKWWFAPEEQSAIAKEFIDQGMIQVVAINIWHFQYLDEHIISCLIKEWFKNYIPKNYLK